MRNLRFALIPTVLFLLPTFVPFVFADWGPDVRLTYNDSASSLCGNYARCIAVDTSGKVHVVWDDYRDAGVPEVYYKRSTDWGSSWGPDVRLTANDSIGSGNSMVDVDRQGRVHVSWYDGRDGNKGEIFYKRSTDGGTTWGPDMRLSDQSKEILPYGIGADALGWVHLLGMTPLSGLYVQFLYRRSRDGGDTWNPWQIVGDSIWGITNASLAIGRGQELHIVTDQMHYLRSPDGGTTWSQDTLLCITPWAIWPDVSVDRANRVHIVWFDQRGGGDSLELFYKQSTDGGITWQPDFKLTHSDTLADYEPVIAGDSTGWVHVLYNVPTHGIFYKRSTDAGVTWNPPYHLIASGVAPHVVVDSRENAHVVWASTPPGGTRPEIYYKKWTSVEGIGEFAGPSPVSHLPFSVRPNPFTSFARIPGHETERFALYDITGRKVGTYRGDRIGEGLAAGVYFIRAADGSSKPLRIVKLR